MREVLKYDINNNLVEVVELNYSGGTEYLYSLNERSLLKFWKRNDENYIEHNTYEEDVKMMSYRSNGERWTRIIKSGSQKIDFPSIKDKIGVSNGFVETFKVKQEFLEQWQKQIQKTF